MIQTGEVYYVVFMGRKLGICMWPYVTMSAMSSSIHRPIFTSPKNLRRRQVGHGCCMNYEAW